VLTPLLCIPDAEADSPEDAGDMDIIVAPVLSSGGLRHKGLAGAGTSLAADEVSTQLINPALINTYYANALSSRFGVYTSYGRDERFPGHGATAGVSFSRDTLGVLCGTGRYLQHDTNRYLYEASICYAGRLFEGNPPQGPVDVGITIRYQLYRWRRDYVGTSGTFVYSPADSLVDTSNVHHWPGREKGHRLFFDLGFFQKRVAQNLDFSLVFHNLLGYGWDKQKPGFLLDSVVFNPDSSQRHVVHAVQEDEDKTGWTAGRYRMTTVGIAFHTPILDDKATVMIPLDCRFFGLLDRGIKVRTSVYSGIEAGFGETFFLRFGYARAPSIPSRTAVAGTGSHWNVNQFSGGAGLHTDHIRADVYVADASWGVGLGVGF